MRILYFSLGYSTHDYRFLKAISDGGHDVYFVQLEGNKRQVESRPIPENVHQVIWKGGKKPFQWKDLISLTLDFRRVIREIKPDVIHAGPIQTCGLVATLSGFHPTLTMSWGFDLMEDVNKNKFMQWITKYVLRHSDYFTSDANVTKDKAVEYGMNPNKTIVFPWGVDLSHFTMRKAESRNKEGFILFCNRSWETRYGVDVLAHAFVQVAQKRDDVRLILLGAGSQGAKLRQIFQRAGVDEFVTYGGQISQNDLPHWYHQADLYISPSHVDGSSVSLLEALACGLPCLVSDIPANKEWVFENENGWLFKDGDSNHLADKILMAMNQPEKLLEMGQTGRRSAEKRADWKKNAEALMDVYRKIHLANAI